MAYQALYRKYRPANFEDVVGQKYIIQTIKNAIDKNKIAHAYLFCGPRGTGKTTVARLLAKSLNCTGKEKPCNTCENCMSCDDNNHQDIIEIDAASSSGVSQIRSLIDNVKYSPIQGRLKVYIIDEVHMLSAGAFNALLKTLEEPPKHVCFILATTEPHKVLATIISRCQRYDFSRVKDDDIIKRIKYITKKEQIEISEEAMKLIAVLADGGMRDALSILDQCIAYGNNEVKVEVVNEIYGITTTKQKLEILNAIIKKDVNKILEMINKFHLKGVDINRLTLDLIDIIKETVIYAYTKDLKLLSIISADDANNILEGYDVKSLLEMIDILLETTLSYKNASNISSYFEVACLKLMGVNASKEETGQVLSEQGKEVSHDVIDKADDQINEEVENIADNEITEDIEVAEVLIETEVDQNDIEAEEVLEENETDQNEIEVEDTLEENDVIQIEEISSEFVLSLLVQARKQSKEEDKEKWIKLEEYLYDFEYSMWAKLLLGTKVVASGDTFILVCAKYKVDTSRINTEANNVEIFKFMSDKIDICKRVFAVNEDSFNSIVNEFKERSKNDTLPEAIEIELYDKMDLQYSKEEKDLMDIFGNDLIIEE